MRKHLLAVTPVSQWVNQSVGQSGHQGGQGDPSYKEQEESVNTEKKCQAKEGVSYQEVHLRVYFCNGFGIQPEYKEAGQRLSM